jgi:site-specific recombinase XerD
MAIEAKVTLLGELERDLYDRLTAAQLAEVMSALADRLNSYTMERLVDFAGTSDDLLMAYINALSVEGRSEKTLERYRYIITRMMESVKVPTNRITVYHLRRYLTDEKTRGISDRTLEGYRQVFSAYFNWLQRERLIENNPTANLGAIKYAKKQKDIYSDADVERMKFSCKTLRDRAIICFLQATGCRVSEVVGLNRDDVDIFNLVATVLGKGNKERTVYLDQVAAMTLQAYLEARKDNSPALFAGKGTDRLQPGAIRQMLVKLGKNAKVTHVHPHKFRRTTATNLIRHGMPIQEVAAILGHDKLDTTMQYVVLDKTAVQYSYKKYA